jgi:hypothetical protein
MMAVAAVSQGQTAPAAKAPQPKLPALTILSLIPAQGEPGMTVSVNGTGFTPTTTAFLGTRELPTAVATGGRILSFELPDVPAGVYALYLKREDGTTSRAFNFTMQPLHPVAAGLTPDTIPACASGSEREVVVSGANFQNGARVVFDGAAIGTRYLTPGAVSFVVPQLQGGLHHVQVKNPSDATSGTLAFFIDSRPEITSVSIGPDHVSYYELIISGRNFQQTSTLVADGARINTAAPAVGDRDQLVFLGCNQLVYLRHPYDPIPKDIRIQIVNPTGEESRLYSVSAP